MRDPRKMREGKKVQEEFSNHNRMLPQVNFSQSRRMGWTLEKVSDGVIVSTTLWTNLVIRMFDGKEVSA
jgi:hypothetical protein